MPPKQKAAKRKASSSKAVSAPEKKPRKSCNPTPASASMQKKADKQHKTTGAWSKDKLDSPKKEPRNKKRSANLSWFLKVYKGMDDWHIPIFQTTASVTGAKHVLYPGSDKHLTASLVFPNVVYVDFNLKLVPVFEDEQVRNWIKDNKLYDQEPNIKFLCKNFDSKFEKNGSFDLLISACAGIVSETCVKYLKKGGHFLVSDSHFDARMTYVNVNFKLVGVFDQSSGELNTDAAELQQHFHTKEGIPISRKQVEESISKPKAKRSFKLKKEAMFYLFRKVK